jgi:hypothetical protein
MSSRVTPDCPGANGGPPQNFRPDGPNGSAGGLRRLLCRDLAGRKSVVANQRGQEGARILAYAMDLGMTLLALPPAVAADILGSDLESFTPNSTTSASVLRRQLESIRETGGLPL